MSSQADVCQCARCECWFDSETAFDKHRAGRHAWDNTRHCRDPAALSMVADTPTRGPNKGRKVWRLWRPGAVAA